MKHLVWLGLGSNQGNRLVNLNHVINLVLEHPNLDLLSSSGVYETEYVGPGNQDKYLNACLAISCNIGLLALLDEFQTLEQSLGRSSDGHMKPRPLDVDILLVDDIQISQPRLLVPHPRLGERLFVLIPLCDIASGKKIPILGETVAQLCAKIKRKDDSVVTPRPDLVLGAGLSGQFMEE